MNGQRRRTNIAPSDRIPDRDSVRTNGRMNPGRVKDALDRAEGRRRNRLRIRSSSFSSVLITTTGGQEIEFTLPGGTEESVTYRGLITEVDVDGEVEIKVNGRTIVDTMPTRPKGGQSPSPDIATPPEAEGGLTTASRNIINVVRERPVESTIGIGVALSLLL